MLMKLFSVSTKDDYRAVLEGRRKIAIGAALLGLVTMLVPVALLFFMPDLDDHALGYFSGGGAAFLCLGLFVTIGIGRTLRDEKRLRSEHIKETDERTQEISRRAASLTILLTMLGLYLALLVAVVVNRTVYYTLLGVLASFLVLFFGALLYYGRKL